jgi:hypothetical protein
MDGLNGTLGFIRCKPDGILATAGVPSAIGEQARRRGCGDILLVCIFGFRYLQVTEESPKSGTSDGYANNFSRQEWRAALEARLGPVKVAQ